MGGSPGGLGQFGKQLPIFFWRIVKEKSKNISDESPIK